MDENETFSDAFNYDEKKTQYKNENKSNEDEKTEDDGDLAGIESKRRFLVRHEYYCGDFTLYIEQCKGRCPRRHVAGQRPHP